MKYYAVADDPNELLHYGRLGMKWGQHIFVGPKSLSYKKAEGKLRFKIQNAKAAIQKSRTQHAINRQQRQQNKFAKAVQKTQQRIALTEGFRDLDRLKAYERSDARAYKNERKAERIAKKTAIVQAKNDLHYANNERKMQKYTQMARKGKLKYGKLSSDQVNQITNRLAIEANARRLGGAEETFRHRLKTATKEGLLQGVTQGVAAGMKEVAIDRVQNRLRNKRAMDKANRNEAQRQKEATRIKTQKTHKEVKQDLKNEAYEAMVESGANVFQRMHRPGVTSAARRLQKADAYKQLTAYRYDVSNDDSRVGRKLAEIKDQKRIAANEEKRRNDIDEKWQKFKDEHPEYQDITTDKMFEYSKNPKLKYETRANKLNKVASDQKKLDENSERAAYDNYDEEVKSVKKYNEDQDVEYQNRLKADKAKNGWRTGYDPDQYVAKPVYKALPQKPNYRNTQKPDWDDFIKQNPIKYDKPEPMPTYDEAKIYRTLGLPSPLANVNNNNNQQKKKQNNGNKK